EDKNNEVVGISRSKEYHPLFLPYKKHQNPKFKFYQLNINDQLDEIFDVLDAFEPEYVVNFAAQGEVGTSWKFPDQWFQTNAVGIVQFTNNLKDKKYLKRYVHISTPEVYGSCYGQDEKCSTINPSTPYAASKAAGDLFISALFKQYNFPVVTIRSTNVYGVGQQLYRIIPRSIILIKKGQKIQLHGGGKSFKSYIHIKDVCQGILKAMLFGKSGEVYHLSPTDEISIKQLVSNIIESLNKEFEDHVEIVDERPGQDAKYLIDSAKAKQAFGWMPKISLGKGINEMTNWIYSNWSEIEKMTIEYIHKK
nr:dTDP-glucose 4,6-dehydratase [Candidatus Anoxychlamydiales bacterium]